MVPEHLTSFFLRYEEPVTDDLAHICDYRETGSALRKHARAATIYESRMAWYGVGFSR